MRNGQSLNLNWKFKDEFKPEYITQKDYGSFADIHVPHTVREIPYDCFDETMCGCLSTYVRFFELPALGEQRVLIEFEGVSTYYDLYVNEQSKNGKPKCIFAHTVKGKGVSFMENQCGWHGVAPNDEQYAQAMKELDEQLLALA